MILGLEFLLSLDSLHYALKLLPALQLNLGPAVEEFIEGHTRTVVLFGMVPVLYRAF